MIQFIRFSVFPPFTEDFDTKSDNNNPSERLRVENEKTKEDEKSEKLDFKGCGDLIKGT